MAMQVAMIVVIRTDLKVSGRGFDSRRVHHKAHLLECPFIGPDQAIDRDAEMRYATRESTDVIGENKPSANDAHYGNLRLAA